MSDLTDFLLARIAEDEAIGGHLDLGAWRAERIAAECAAKRQIVKLRAVDSGDYGAGYDDAADDATRALVLPYANHPDCRKEWRP